MAAPEGFQSGDAVELRVERRGGVIDWVPAQVRRGERERAMLAPLVMMLYTAVRPHELPCSVPCPPPGIVTVCPKGGRGGARGLVVF